MENLLRSASPLFGATIQGSYLVRGAPEGNHIMMSPDHEEGFGYLHNVAIDQHIETRGREHDLAEVIARRPELLGLGLDERTAVLVQGNVASMPGHGGARLEQKSGRISISGDPLSPSKR